MGAQVRQLCWCAWYIECDPFSLASRGAPTHLSLILCSISRLSSHWMTTDFRSAITRPTAGPEVTSGWSIPWWIWLVIAIGAFLGGLALAGCGVGFFIALNSTSAKRRKRRKVALSTTSSALSSARSSAPFQMSSSFPALITPRFELEAPVTPKQAFIEIPPIQATHHIYLKWGMAYQTPTQFINIEFKIFYTIS